MVERLFYRQKQLAGADVSSRKHEIVYVWTLGGDGVCSDTRWGLCIPWTLKTPNTKSTYKQGAASSVGIDMFREDLRF